jgi:hypothetical protein
MFILRPHIDSSPRSEITGLPAAIVGLKRDRGEKRGIGSKKVEAAR